MSYHYTTKSAYVPPYVPYSPIAVSNDNRTIYVHTGLFRWSDTVVGVSSFEKNPTKFHNYLLYWLHEEYSFFIVINKIFFFFLYSSWTVLFYCYCRRLGTSSAAADASRFPMYRHVQTLQHVRGDCKRIAHIKNVRIQGVLNQDI